MKKVFTKKEIADIFANKTETFEMHKRNTNCRILEHCEFPHEFCGKLFCCSYAANRR